MRDRCSPQGLPPARLPPRRTGSGVPWPSAALWTYVQAGSLTPRTFFSLVFLGSCCTARAKPALSCSRPAPTPCQSSTFPSAATLSTWKRWLCRGSGSQTTWATGRGARSQEDTCPTSRQGQLSASTRPSPSLPGKKKKKKGDFLQRLGSHLTHQGADPEGSEVPPSPRRKPGRQGLHGGGQRPRGLPLGVNVTPDPGAPRMPEAAGQALTPW